MRKALLICGALTLILISGALGAAAARPGRAGPGGPDGTPHGPLARLMMAARGRAMTLHAELDLTDQQRDAVKQTILAHKSDLAAAIQPAVAAHRALRDAVL